MNINVTHVVVHTPDAVRDIVREAVIIADEAAGETEGWPAVFTAACRLLGQRHTIAVGQEPIPVDLAALTGTAGRRP